MTTTPSGHDECQCSPCRVARAGLGPGPYTPAQYAKIAPPVLPVSNPFGEFLDADPDVVEARQKVALAREALAAVERDWLARFVEVRQAALVNRREQARRSGVYVVDDNELMVVVEPGSDDQLAEIKDRKEAAHKALMRANAKEQAAQYAAQLRFLAAEREAEKPKPAPRRSRGGMAGLFGRA